MAKWVGKQRDLNVKIAVVGQSGSGKINIINQLAVSKGQSSVSTTALADAEVSRTQFIWPEPLADGTFVRVKIYALCGDPKHQALEQCLLNQADGVVYVVNCDPQMIHSSRESLLNMLKNASSVGIDWQKSVIVMQYNQADKYPNFIPSDLDGWLGITNGNVARHITSSEGENLGVAVMDAAEKVIRRLKQEATALEG